MRIVDTFQGDILRWRKCFTFVGVSVRVLDKVLKLFLAPESIYFFVEEGKVLIIFKTYLYVLSFDLVAYRAEIEIVREVVHDAITTKAYVSDFSGSMSNEIFNENSFSFDLVLYFSPCLLKNSPFGEMTFNDFDVIVFVGVINFNFN